MPEKTFVLLTVLIWAIHMDMRCHYHRIWHMCGLRDTVFLVIKLRPFASYQNGSMLHSYTALSVVAVYVLALMPKKCSDHVQLELPRFDMSFSTWQCTWSKFSLSFWNCGNTWTWSYCQQNNILSLSNVTQQKLIKFVILHSLRCAQHRDRMYPMTSPGYQAIQTQITYGPPWNNQHHVQHFQV